MLRFARSSRRPRPRPACRPRRGRGSRAGPARCARAGASPRAPPASLPRRRHVRGPRAPRVRPAAASCQPRHRRRPDRDRTPSADAPARRTADHARRPSAPPRPCPAPTRAPRRPAACGARCARSRPPQPSASARPGGTRRLSLGRRAFLALSPDHLSVPAVAAAWARPAISTRPAIDVHASQRVPPRVLHHATRR